MIGSIDLKIAMTVISAPDSMHKIAFSGWQRRELGAFFRESMTQYSKGTLRLQWQGTKMRGSREFQQNIRRLTTGNQQLSHGHKRSQAHRGTGCSISANSQCLDTSRVQRR